MPSHDDLGDRMKEYEAVTTSLRLDPSLPVYARIDGRAFHTFTRGMPKPYSAEMIYAMQATTAYLVEETHARLGYTQSDEISLVWQAEGENSDIFFSGKLLKMASVLAGMATAKFGSVCPLGHAYKLPHFDARVFSLPTREEAANALLWRALDARKNAILQLAHSHFSVRQMHGKRQPDLLQMLDGIGVNFEDAPTSFKRGSFYRRETEMRELLAWELERIPEKYRPTGAVQRSSVNLVDMPPLWDVKNRVDVIFNGADPLTVSLPSSQS